jgi:hypothetical protein
MLVIRFNPREVSVKNLVRVVQIEVAALRLPMRKLFTDAVDEKLPHGLACDLNDATDELGCIALGRCANHCS